MENSVENLENQFFFGQFKSVCTIAESEKCRVELIFYEPRQTVCVLKTYFNRDLSDVYCKLKQICHENLVAVYDVLFFDGKTYVIEENIDGATLAERLCMQGTFSEKEVISITEKVCEAMKQLHNQTPPLIHRDIKPSNVMIQEDGTIKLIDFETVRTYRENNTKDTVLLGTEEYASPEHYGYGQTDVTSDIYSIGVMMNELLTGEILAEHKATYKGKLLPVINRCIQIDYNKRFQSVQELQNVLSTYEKTWGILLRNKKKFFAGCVGILVILVLSAGYIKNRMQWPNLEQAYFEEVSPRELLENAKVDYKLQKLLGVKYDYVKECLYMIDTEVQFSDGVYYFEGQMPGLYNFMEAAISLSENEEIECAFLEDGKCNYYASDDALYDSPSYWMKNWLSSYEDYTIQFHDKSENESSGITGSYIREDSSAYIILQETEEGKYSVKGTATWGINTGEIEGELEQINSQQFLYTEFPGEEYQSELKIVVYDDKLFVETLQGQFGGLNVTFDGTYKK